MMMYNCNANAEYLLDVLGIDNVKNNNELFGLTRHTAIFPPVASMFLYQNPKKLKEKEILNGIKNLSEEQYCRIVYEIHKALEYDTLLKPKFSTQEFDTKMQKLWSSRLTASTTKEYVEICKILNNRKFLADNTYEVVAEVIETAMESPDKVTWLMHEGIKEGRTPWLFTKVLYATEKDGTKIEIAYFFNDLTPEENNKLSLWANDFEKRTLTDEGFRQKMAKTLN
jgi:D-alanyl-D-alanine carboxypeptidase